MLGGEVAFVGSGRNIAEFRAEPSEILAISSRSGARVVGRILARNEAGADNNSDRDSDF